MIQRTLVSLALLTATLVSSAKTLAEDPAAGKQVAQSTTFKSTVDGEDSEVTLRYWLYVPKDYDQIDTAPFMLFLHGAGERGDDLTVVKKWGPPKLIEGGQGFPFIVASPQCPSKQGWRAEELAQLVDHLAGKYKIDRERMYCTGLSMGGYGTWSILAKYPKLFAAGAPICGGGRTDDAEKLKSIPIWSFHGDADRVVPVSKSQEMVDAIKQVGGEKVQLTIYPGVNHNSWTPAYANPKLYDWLLSHQRAK